MQINDTNKDFYLNSFNELQEQKLQDIKSKVVLEYLIVSGIILFLAGYILVFLLL